MPYLEASTTMMIGSGQSDSRTSELRTDFSLVNAVWHSCGQLHLESFLADYLVAQEYDVTPADRSCSSSPFQKNDLIVVASLVGSM